jgi:hypothetical protein
MEYTHRNYSHEEEVMGFCVSLSNEGTNSNGHGEGKKESVNLVETITSVQNDVQSYNTDNERLMKAKEQQEGFNNKLVQSLEKIEKKMDERLSQANQRVTDFMVRGQE